MDCYTERAHLLALLAVHHDAYGYIDSEGEEGFKHVIALFVGHRWLCWHIADADLELFAHVGKWVEANAIYDGHTTSEKYQSIRDYLH